MPSTDTDKFWKLNYVFADSLFGVNGVEAENLMSSILKSCSNTCIKSVILVSSSIFQYISPRTKLLEYASSVAISMGLFGWSSSLENMSQFNCASDC